MPKEVLRIDSGLQWKAATVTPTAKGLQTELIFEVDGRPFSVTFDSVPDKVFLGRLMHIRCIGIFTVSAEERGWVESGRFRIRINDDDEIDDATQSADDVHWRHGTA